MQDVSELIKAISTLLWPIIALIALFLFKNQFRLLIQRVKKGKFFGQEIELEETLHKLQSKSSSAYKEAASIPRPKKENDKIEEEFDAIQTILSEVSKSPEVGLILLSVELEKEIKKIWASTGLINSQEYRTLQEAIRILERRSSIPRSVASSLELFEKVRNQIIHGHSYDEKNIYSAIDSGIHVLKAIKAIPREINYVYSPGVEVYSDPKGQNKRDDVRAIILETTSPGGSNKYYRVSS